MFVQRPTKIDFEAPGGPVFIKDLACGFNHCLALSVKNELFVWGRRMGMYPNIEITHANLLQKQNLFTTEINQATPRLVKNNVIFYKIKKLAAGPFNSGFVTEDGYVCIQGNNEMGQLGFPEEITKLMSFFPEFRKLDYFSNNKLHVIDLSFGATATYVLCNDGQKNRVFSFGSNDYG